MIVEDLDDGRARRDAKRQAERSVEGMETECEPRHGRPIPIASGFDRRLGGNEPRGVREGHFCCITADRAIE